MYENYNSIQDRRSTLADFIDKLESHKIEAKVEQIIEENMKPPDDAGCFTNLFVLETDMCRDKSDWSYLASCHCQYTKY